MNNLSCPFCGAEIIPRVENQTYQIKHNKECAIMNFIHFTCLDETEEFHIIQEYDLDDWNRRIEIKEKA